MTRQLTFEGRYVDLLAPQWHDISIIDIAYALGHINRFNGHAGPYTVAQHSVLVSHLVPPELAAHALLHDAAEAYLGDVTAPLKQALGDQLAAFEALEQRFDAAILAKLLPAAAPLDDEARAAIRRADLDALALEQRLILGNDDDWPGVDIPEFVPSQALDFFLTRGTLLPWEMFLRRAAELGLAATTETNMVRRALDQRSWRRQELRDRLIDVFTQAVGDQ